MGDFAKEVEDYFCKFTFGQFVTIILLELVTLFFVFYLGARYGPDLIGGKRADVAAEKVPASPEGVGKPEMDYSFPEVLEGKDRTVIRVKPSGMTAREYEDSQRVVVPLPEPPREIVEEPKKLQAPEMPKELAADLSEPGKYAIQVGSYPSAEEAKTVIDRWKGRGYHTFMTIGEIPQKGTWYRVRIGRFKNRDEAKGFLEKFKQKEKAEGLVVLSKS